jgi:hypothetical protein
MQGFSFTTAANDCSCPAFRRRDCLFYSFSHRALQTVVPVSVRQKMLPTMTGDSIST